MNTISDRENRSQLIQALIVYRMIIITFFLALVVVFHLEFNEYYFPYPLSWIAAGTYFLSIIYLFFLTRLDSYTLFLYVQFTIDLITETAIIYFAGGFASPFTFLYLLTIIAVSIVLPRPASYATASAASIFYGVMVNLEFYGIISPVPFLTQAIDAPAQGYLFFTTLSHICAFYIVAFLSDFLSQRVRNTFLELVSKSQDLTALQTFHQNVIEHMGSGLLVLDMDKKILSANLSGLKILETGHQSVYGKKLDDLFILNNTEALPAQEGNDNAEINTNATCLVEENRKKEIALASSFYRDSFNRILGYIVIFQDVTAIKRMEENVTRSERLASIGRIAAGLAHEIRNPLGSISGSLQLLKQGSEGENNKKESNEKLMSIILRETERLNNIIGNFLSSASPRDKKVEGIILSDIIGEALLLFKNDLEYREKVEITTELDDTAIVNADPEALKQVFWNMVLNSAQAMEKKGNISITMKRMRNPAGNMEIRFSDDGKGISEADAMRIFEPFYTTKESGTGLGLSSALKIIENHNGTISIAHNKPSGTVFIIRLPLHPHPSETP
jgi:two-component system sensor histidine kinase PilS (NtrC family)